MKRALLVLLLLTHSAAAQILPRTTPEDVGLSSERLARIDAVMQDHVDRKAVAGVVTLVARRGKIAHVGTYGSADVEANRPMRPDTIFRIASMTKAITSVAAMMLYEEGKFMLSDAVGKYIPEFQEQYVLPPAGATNNYRVAAKRPITIRHLLSHTSGLTYQWNKDLGPLYRDYGITHGLLQDPSTILEKMKILAGLPLLFHPGKRYEYGLNTDVLGALVEVWSGMPLDEFFAQRIFTPLGMIDTQFYLPEEKVERLAAVYSDKAERLGEEPIQGEGSLVISTSYPYQGPKTYFSGGGGLTSTAVDYARFAQMMVNGGVLGEQRLLSPRTVSLMSMDHAGKITGNSPLDFGLGFYVDSSERGLDELTVAGTYGWGGFWYTQFFINPADQMIGVFMAQLYPSGGLKLNRQFKVLAHQAIVE